MRVPILAALATLCVLGAGACSSTGTENPTTAARNSGGDDTARLQSQCDARGGNLVPTGRLTGQAPLDNACDLTGSSASPHR